MIDVYAEVTDRIVAELEKGIIPWKRPWTGVRTGAVSRATGKPYNILNQMLLGEPGEYVTFKQCNSEGGRVKKGSKAKMVIFWKPITRAKLDADGQPIKTEDGLPMTSNTLCLRSYPVFHINDCEGLEPKFKEPTLTDIEPDEYAENVIQEYAHRSGVTVMHEKQNRAYYSPSSDLIMMPVREQFTNTAEYYGTLFHESVHSTGHKSRLNRFDPDSAPAAFGSADYSKEELVAEIGSSIILHEMKIETDSSFRNNAAYIQNWLGVLKNDKKFIVSAASKAEKAVNMILNIQPAKAE